MDAEKLPFGLSRETTIRRTAEGKWFHDGEAIDNPKLARAFDRWVQRAEDGRYCLKNAINWAYISLEGAPYFVRGVRIEGGRARLSLSNDESHALRPVRGRRPECSLRVLFFGWSVCAWGGAIAGVLGGVPWGSVCGGAGAGPA